MSGQELDFIAELDAAISNVGSDAVWERTIGGVKLLISPLTVVSQEKVTELITKMDGPSIVAESKRVTLSHAIVGVEQFDLRRFRGAGPAFPVRGRDGKVTKVTLDKYVYDKLGAWGSQYVDDVFAVYADLMESFQKANLRDVKFENAKNPLDELVELEARVHELRAQLKMPDLIERPRRGVADEEMEEEPDTEPPAAPEPDVVPADFDPFARVRGPSRAEPVEPAPVQPAREQQRQPDRAAAIAASEPDFDDAARRAASPPLERMDVVEAPAQRAVVQPPVIDPAPSNRNPRFAGPRR